MFKQRQQNPLFELMTATALLPAAFALLIGGKQFIDSPIRCQVPPHQGQGYTEYAESLCYLNSSYYVPLHKDSSDASELVPLRSR